MAAHDSVEATVRRIGREIDDRLEDASLEEYLEDEEFLGAVALLQDDDVGHATVAKLARSSSEGVTCIAFEALRRRSHPPPEWIRWAIRRTGRAAHLETCFALRALEIVDEPVVARVLAQSSEGWEYDALLEAVAKFVQERLARGEKIEASDLSALGDDQQSFVAALGEQFDDGLPEPLATSAGRCAPGHHRPRVLPAVLDPRRPPRGSAPRAVRAA